MWKYLRKCDDHLCSKIWRLMKHVCITSSSNFLLSFLAFEVPDTINKKMQNSPSYTGIYYLKSTTPEHPKYCHFHWGLTALAVNFRAVVLAGADHFPALNFLIYKVSGLDLSLVFKLCSSEFLGYINKSCSPFVSLTTRL